MPTTVLVVSPPWLSESSAPELLITARDEISERTLWSWQRELLFRSCLKGHPERRPGTESWFYVEGRLIDINLANQSGLAESQLRRLYDALAPQLLPTRRTWPVGLPIRIGSPEDSLAAMWLPGEQDRQLVAALGVPHVAFSTTLEGWATTTETETPRPRTVSTWNDNTVDLGVLPPGTTVTAHFQLTEHGRIIWERTAELTTVTGSLTELIEPTPAELSAGRSGIFHDRASVRISSPSVSFTLNNSALASALRGGTFGVIVEVCQDGHAIASGRYWAAPALNAMYCYPQRETVQLTGDLSPLLTAPDDDSSWTIRFRGDPETALRNFSATHCWSGELTLTRDQFIVTR